MLRLVTVCRPAKALIFYSGHADVCTAIIIIMIIIKQKKAVSGKKKLRIQKYPDTCGRGLSCPVTPLPENCVVILIG